MQLRSQAFCGSMGSNFSSKFKLNSHAEEKLRLDPVIMSKEEVNTILSNRNNWPGTFIIYEDLKREKIGLAVKCINGDIKHHTIVIINDLYYLKSFPFPYLESIVLYYRKHKLNGTKLTCQADWNSYMKPRRSARITQHLMSTILPTNANNISARDKLLLYKSKSLRL